LDPHWIENTISVNGSAIHYTRTGDGSKPALVLAHGYSDNGLCWLRLSRDLEAHYDVILPDARGHGQSARVQTGEAISLAADLAGLINALGLNHPIVGGHSMGAATASEMDAAFPGVARALLLEDPPWRMEVDPNHAGLDPYTQWLKTVKNLSDETITIKCRADSPSWGEIEIPAWVQSKKQFDTNFIYGKFGPSHPWQEVVIAIGCPTLLLTADLASGAIVTPDLAQQAAAMNPLIHVVKIANAGHNIRRENYADYFTAIAGFLKELAA
jgi:N-formylmaleamate deformylase